MSRQYKNIVYTKQLSKEGCKTCLAEIINILRGANIEFSLRFYDYKQYITDLGKKETGKLNLILNM
jgi:hypothetical protein